MAVDSFIDIVGQNWPINTKLRTPLQRTVIQRGICPRCPQLSQIAWESEKSQIFIRDKEALSGNTEIFRESHALRGDEEKPFSPIGNLRDKVHVLGKFGSRGRI